MARWPWSRRSCISANGLDGRPPFQRLVCPRIGLSSHGLRITGGRFATIGRTLRSSTRSSWMSLGCTRGQQRSPKQTSRRTWTSRVAALSERSHRSTSCLGTPGEIGTSSQLPPAGTGDANLLAQLVSLTPTGFEAAVVSIFRELEEVRHNIARTRRRPVMVALILSGRSLFRRRSNTKFRS